MKSDILIIGGGIAGLSAAATLAPHVSVTLLETEDALGYHASGRSAAMFLRDYGNEVVRALNYASAAHHETAGGGMLSKRGMMLVARPDQFEAFKSEHSQFGLQEISVAEALNYLPILNQETCGYAAYRPDAYDLDADRLLQTYTADARRAGATVQTKSRVTEITKSNGIWHIVAGGQTYRAQTLVNAAGAWVDQIAALAGTNPLGFQPYRRSMARLPAPGGHDVSAWPFVDGVNESWYAKPDAGKWIVSPSEEEPVEPHDAWADDMVLAEGLARYEEMMSEPVTRLETSWAGLRTFAPDRALVIGRDTSDPSFFWLAGQGGYGFQTAPAASQLTADLLLGRAPELDANTVAALSPMRFD